MNNEELEQNSDQQLTIENALEIAESLDPSMTNPMYIKVIKILAFKINAQSVEKKIQEECFDRLNKGMTQIINELQETLKSLATCRLK